MDLDPDAPEPLYVQLAAVLRAQMDAGELLPRRAVPSKRTLQARYQVSAGTIDRCMELLRSEHRIETVRGKGLYVTAPGSWKQP
jgi:GntR family transcriptional regulator